MSTSIKQKIKSDTKQARELYLRVLQHSAAYAKALGFCDKDMRSSDFRENGGGLCYVAKTGYGNIHTLAWPEIMELLTDKEKARFFDAVAQPRGEYNWVAYNIKAAKKMFTDELNERIGSHKIIVYAKHLCACPYGGSWQNVVMAKPAKSCADKYYMKTGGGTTQIHALCEEWHRELIAALNTKKDDGWWNTSAHIWP